MKGPGGFRTSVTTLMSLVAIASALATPAGGSTVRRDALPTRVPGTLTVGVDIGTVGLAEGNVVNGKLTHASGFEIDLARALAGKLGLKLRVIDVPFAVAFAPGKKSFDVDIGHVTITPQRAKVVSFSPPYFIVNK